MEEGWTALEGVDGVYFRTITEEEVAEEDAEFWVIKDNTITVKETVTKEQLNELDAEGAENYAYVEEETTAPTEETTKPTEETTEPTEDTTEPPEETTAPTEEITEPTGETTEPDETTPSAEPTSPITKPTSPGGNAGTGDDSLISMYLAAMTLSLCTAALLLLLVKRSKKERYTR